MLERDPLARLAILPSDHFVRKEYVIEASLRLAGVIGIRRGCPHAARDHARLGRYRVRLDRAGVEILHSVECFIEKPDLHAAIELYGRGAVWNSFLFAASGPELLRCYESRLPGLLIAYRTLFAGDPGTRDQRLDVLYDELETQEFSRDVLQGIEDRLRLEIVPPCGWTDIGTPARLEACIASLPEELGPCLPGPTPEKPVLSNLVPAPTRDGGRPDQSGRRLHR